MTPFYPTHSLIEHTSIGMLVWNADGSLQSINDAALHFLGYDRSSLTKQRAHALFHLKKTEINALRSGVLHDQKDKDTAPPLEKIVPHSDGTPRRVLLVVLHSDDVAIQCMMIDITRRHLVLRDLQTNYRRLEEMVSHQTKDLMRLNHQLREEIQRHRSAAKQWRSMSLRDVLTGLYNRRGFHEAAQQRYELCRRHGRAMACFLADLDGLKQINDQWGHAMGDEAIVKCSHVLRRSFRRTDIIARIGGDEFAGIGMDLKADDAYVYEQRLKEELNRENKTATFPIELSFSIGIAICTPQKPIAFDQLLAEADSRLYHNKSQRSLAQSA